MGQKKPSGLPWSVEYTQRIHGFRERGEIWRGYQGQEAVIRRKWLGQGFQPKVNIMVSQKPKWGRCIPLSLIQRADQLNHFTKGTMKALEASFYTSTSGMYLAYPTQCTLDAILVNRNKGIRNWENGL